MASRVKKEWEQHSNSRSFDKLGIHLKPLIYLARDIQNKVNRCHFSPASWIYKPCDWAMARPERAVWCSPLKIFDQSLSQLFWSANRWPLRSGQQISQTPWNRWYGESERKRGLCEKLASPSDSTHPRVIGHGHESIWRQDDLYTPAGLRPSKLHSNIFH